MTKYKTIKGYLTCLLFIALNCSLLSQTNPYCAVLKEILYDNKFRLFFQDSIKNKPLIIADTSSLFKNCNCEVKNRKIVVTKEWNHWTPDLGNNVKFKDFIVVYAVTRKSETINCMLWNPYSNGVLGYNIKRVKRHFIIKITSEGVF